jgi:uncharacterized coiled-coil DUF342 family protein
MAKLDRLVEELDEVRGEIRAVEKQRVECERTLAELRNEERNLRRKIEREAHLSLWAVDKSIELYI